MDRWLSGMAQWMSGASRGSEPVDAAIERMIFDVHTTPQAWWLEGLTPTLFRLEHIDALWAHLGITARVHKQKRRGETLKLPNIHIDRILEFYSADLALWRGAR